MTHVVENPSGSAVHTYYDYDTLGNLTLVCHGAAISNHACSAVVQQRSFTYDWLGRLLSATNPETQNQETTYTSYDGNGNLLSKTDAAGVTVSYGYDNWNRMASTTYTNTPTPAVTYCYDGDASGACAGAPSGAGNNLIGRLTAADAREFDGGDDGIQCVRRARKRTGEHADSASYPFTYRYDIAGLTRESYPSGRVVALSHDAAGRIATLWNREVNSANKYAASVTYASHGGLSGMTLGNGKYEETCYNNRLQASGIRVGAATTSGTCQNPGTDETYVYDGEGRRVKKVQGGSTTVYVYDAGGQLAAEYVTAAGGDSGTQYLTMDHLGSTRLVTGDTMAGRFGTRHGQRQMRISSARRTSKRS